MTAPLIELPSGALVLLVGPAGCGKTTFAARNFRPTQVVSSDALRAVVADDPADPRASADAFELMYLIADRRLRRNRLTVIDATNVHAEKRAELIAVARRNRRPVVAIVFDLPVGVCLERNLKRPDRRVPAAAIHGQRKLMRESLPMLAEEGVDRVWVLRTPQEADAAVVATQSASLPVHRATARSRPLR